MAEVSLLAASQSWSDLLYYTAARPKGKLDWSTDREFGRTSLLASTTRVVVFVSSRREVLKKGDIFIDLCRLEQVVCLAVRVVLALKPLLLCSLLFTWIARLRLQERQVRDFNEERLFKRRIQRCVHACRFTKYNLLLRQRSFSKRTKNGDSSKLKFLLIMNRFINARRRIVQPLIDQSNRAGAPGESPEPISHTLFFSY